MLAPALFQLYRKFVLDEMDLIKDQSRLAQVLSGSPVLQDFVPNHSENEIPSATNTREGFKYWVTNGKNTQFWNQCSIDILPH